jgi:CheY-like chemotaxis protein
MPERDGIEVIRVLRRQFPPLPIIAMSGGTQHGTTLLQVAQSLGAQRFFQPSRLPELLAAVRELTGAETP